MNRFEKIKDVLRILPEEQLMFVYNKFVDTDPDYSPIIPMRDFDKYCSGILVEDLAEKFLRTTVSDWSFSDKYFKEGDGDNVGQMFSIAEGCLADSIWLDDLACYIDDTDTHFGIDELMDIIYDEYMVIIRPDGAFDRYETVKASTKNMAIELLMRKFGENAEIKKVYKVV